ncbi:hypothetical protein Btru_072447 [Bulinus truncatus]|nr:hypothetical protein Btru_072447 [Bulinus truncatus]
MSNKYLVSGHGFSLETISSRLESSKNWLFKRSEVYNGHRYYLSQQDPIGRSEQSMATCVLYGGYLAEIDDVDEFNFTKTFIKQFSGFKIVLIGRADDEAEELTYKSLFKLLQRDMMLNPCEKNWISEVYNGHRYYLSQQDPICKSEQFMATCVLYGGYLVEIDDEAEFNFTQAFIKQFSGFSLVLIGGTDEETEESVTAANRGVSLTQEQPAEESHLLNNSPERSHTDSAANRGVTPTQQPIEESH